MKDVLTAISSVGFPIVACMAVAYYCYILQKWNTQEVANLTNAINNNTIVVQKLKEMIEVKKEG